MFNISTCIFLSTKISECLRGIGSDITGGTEMKILSYRGSYLELIASPPYIILQKISSYNIYDSM
jgi:hypothetical protein